MQSPVPRSPGRRFRNRSASNGRGSSASCRRVVGERKSFMWAHGGEADDVAVGTDAARNFAAELQQDARRICVRIGDLQGGVGLEIADVRQTVRGIAKPASGGLASARCGMTVAAAAPAAATPAPERNQRRPISTLRSHLFMRFPIARMNNGETVAKAAPCGGLANRPAKSTGAPQSRIRMSVIPNTPSEGGLAIRTELERRVGPSLSSFSGQLSRPRVLGFDLIAVHLFPERGARNLEPLRRFADLSAGLAKHTLDLALFRRVANGSERKDRIASSTGAAATRETGRPASATGPSRD